MGHRAVLPEQTINNLVTVLDGIYIDCTAGGGGHLELLAQRLNAQARIYALDKDAEVMAQTEKKLARPNITFIHGDFRRVQSLLSEQGVTAVDGIMLDLGVSSFQLDQAERGFSFHDDGPLDMRMDRSQGLNAADLLNTWSEDEISRILFLYGEERYAKSIARGIVNYRQQHKITTTLQLAHIIRRSVPARYSREQHPARRSFQAIRIAVNEEMDALQEVLSQCEELLKPGGRLCVITFHSLEDRAVKHYMQEAARDCICPPSYPVCVCQHRARLKLISRKSIVADDEELAANNRARSARLRVAEKL
ncbi:MAG: 16S rRNA (cytosine(1402)-N(4))-methyltransferase RsmH [Syntrophomonadaceae bacterium]|nr:16S rRNA (cytosine(1402)-N(4))-methyltransferase RsmH [Syntrophomonadaceae bacterium]